MEKLKRVWLDKKESISLLLKGFGKELV